MGCANSSEGRRSHLRRRSAAAALALAHTVSGDRQLYRCAVARVVAHQAQGRATQGGTYHSRICTGTSGGIAMLNSNCVLSATWWIWRMMRAGREMLMMNALSAACQFSGSRRVARRPMPRRRQTNSRMILFICRTSAVLAKGDVLVVIRLDRVARSTRDLLNLLETIVENGAGFKSLEIPGLTPRRRTRREAGEVLSDIARSYNVSHSTISRLR